MRYAQLLVYETDGLLAALLRPLAEGRRWLVREPRRPEACMRLLRRSQPAVLVLRLETDVLLGLSVLERVWRLCPQARTVVIGDTANSELCALAWHLGAGYVLLPPQARSRLPEVVAALMDAAAGQQAADLAVRGEGTGPADDELPEASLEDE